jgi:carboxyl-terminal processing protease
MRTLIKGFVAVSIVSAGFLCGLTNDVLTTAVHNPKVGSIIPSVPASRVARLLEPASARAADGNSTALQPTPTYNSVMKILQRDFYNPAGTKSPQTDTTKLTYAAIDGMLSSLNDVYTTFWTPKEYKQNMEDTRGDFVGIGASLDLTKDKKVLIVKPLENSPAINAGILPGDIIAGVDGKSITGIELSKVITKIRGKEGTYVRLTIERKGKPAPFEVSIKRAVVHSPVIDSRMQDEENKIGYISLAMFNEQADAQFDLALEQLEKQGMKALIFDLRNNPGGLLNISQDIASRFIESGPIVWVKQKSGQMDSLNVRPNKHRSSLFKGDYPLIVLVNGSSASASEIVSGAIQDAGVGKLLGTTTFGKGLVQTIFPLDSGDSAVKITTQHYFTRNKHDINKKLDASGKQISGGIKPDYVVELTEKDLDAQREALRNDPQNREAFNKLDPQLKRATEILREQLSAKKTAMK